MDTALEMKEKREALDAEVAQIKKKNFEAIKERCRVDVAKKGERMDFLGRLQKERREAIREENILRSQEAGELLPEQIEQTRRLAEGVLRLKNSEILEKKNCQLLRSRDIELKELETQLKSTYAAKTAKVQLKERQAFREDDKYLENQCSVLRARWYNDDAFDRRMEREELERKTKRRNDIQDQLINNELLRRQRSEENHRERKIVEEISEVLYRENMQLAREREEKFSHARAEREAFFKASKIWKCKEKEALLDEFNRHYKIIADKMTEDNNKARKKYDESRARDSVAEKSARKMLDDYLKRMEREYIVNELIIEEENNEVAENIRNETIKKDILKRELLADMEQQKLIIAERKAQDAAVDAAFGKYVAEQYEMAVKNDEENKKDRRLKGVRYGKDLEAVCEEHRAIHAEQVLARQSLHRRDEELEHEHLKKVAFERSKILYEHAANLRGFIKPGTLRPEDYEYAKTIESNPEMS